MGDSTSLPVPSVPGSTEPNSVRAEVDVDQVERLSHTQGFDADEYLITRRDTEFPLTLHSNSQPRVEEAKLVHASGSEIELKLGDQNVRCSGTVAKLTVPADAAVTVYKLTVSGKYEDGEAFQVTLRRLVVVLFNAWSKNDGVFVENEEWREEYVLNSDGRVYAGDLYGMPWKLALYRPDSLRAVIWLLENVSNLTFDQKRNPVLVSREMSALVNVQDENGVLVGRWDGEYGDGRPPTFWRGSGQILSQYFQSGGQPVRYGQCWVFSGVLLTVLRILGIPSRSVTNFNSAHDTNRNRTIDQYHNEEGDRVRYLSSGSDSVWNFHVWNEVWLARPDLPAGFDGWQAVDSTPQEESPQGGGYRTGPASLKAIKEGNSVVFDTNFVIAEVNADIKKFMIEEHGAPRLFEVNTSIVGKTISTKALGSTSREDVTDQYKYAEGSDWERRALYSGYDELMKEQHEVDFEIPEVQYKFGQDVKFEVRATNRGKIHRIRGQILCEAITYTGRVLKEVEKLRVDSRIPKGKTEVFGMNVDGSVFSEYPGTKVYLSFEVLLAVHGTSQVFSTKVPIAPNPPELKITGPDKIGLGDEAKVGVTFVNPLPIKMENVTLNVESDELLNEDVVHNIGTIGPNAEVTYTFNIVGLKLGKHELVVGLDSDKVEMVTGEKQVEVLEHVVDPPSHSLYVTVPLEVQSIDLNLAKNRSAHHTDSYDERGLVVRRGQAFSLTLSCKQSLPAGTKIVCHGVFQLVSRLPRKPYTFEVDTVSIMKGSNITVDLKPPADVAIGRYTVILTLDNGGKVSVVEQQVSLYLLFNPWSTEDTCHYHKESDLNEYVLNNRGYIWVGSAYSNYGRPWQFAQYKKDCTDVSFWLLDKLTHEDRADPVKVSRHISAMVNVQDDNGILVGNWSGDYTGGKPPTYWTGSAEILDEFNRTKQPVKFAQCWVFSGVQTSILRCLGLPARSITNFNSAHDTHFNRAIDKFFYTNGDEISSGDSIWNFHVWNEAHMARPDLPTGFGGWQVLDATPQEESPQGGGYRLGPSPRQAIKLGQRMNYDVEFVISEVNADIRYYTVNPDRTLTLTRVNSTHVGKNISTKAVGSSAREDVTLDYKFAERSTSERAALLAETESEKEIGLDLSVDDNIMIGQDFFARVTVTNKTSKARDFQLSLKGHVVLYTGASGQLVKSLEQKMRLKGKESKEVEMWVQPVDYLRILEGGYFLHFVAMAIVPTDMMSLVTTSGFRFKTPDILITLPSKGLKLYEEATIKVAFENPLGKRLTNGKFSLHGEGYIQDATVDIGPVGPYGTASAEFTTFSVKRGAFEMVVRFSSDQLADILNDEDTEVV